MKRLARRLLCGLVLAFGACTVPEYGFDNGGDASSDASGGTGGSAGDASADVAVDQGGDAGSSGCQSNAECAALAATPICDTSTSTCVECLPQDDVCTAGTYCVETTCVVGCNDDEDCVPSGLGRPRDPDGGADGGSDDGGASDGGSSSDAGVTLTCDLTKNLCVGCVNDWDCPLATICDGATSTCIPGCIDASTCPASFDCCNNECVNPQTRVDHCGGCDLPCAPENGTGKCEAGGCAVATCDPGYGDCNGLPGDGCESVLAGDPAHCGGCGQGCAPLLNADPGCSQGICTLGDCKSGFANCNAVASDGCEVNLLAHPANCGSCGFGCSLLNANAVCQAGVCAIASCNAGYSNCDNDVSNGCETNTQSSAQNCGSCGNTCAFPNAAASCSGGQCQLGSCAAPYANCDANAANGCETNLNTSTSHCGTCGKVCSSSNGTATCNGGSCGIVCNTGRADCDNNPDNGCEINLTSNPNHCGGCGSACSSNNGTPSCSAGQCGINCSAGFGNCDGSVSNGCETNLNTSSSHCGACNNACGANATCQSGQCQTTGTTCTPPQADCNNNPADGCEINTNTNPSHCGGCGNVCSAANATTGCSSGNCTIASCGMGFANCDGLYSNGCEVNTNTNNNHCGACGTTCTVANGTGTCVNGTCAIASCNAGFANCDGLYSNGCEVNTNTSTSHCGACGTTCTNANGSTQCSAGVCNPTCATGWGNCDGDPKNGCETSTTTLSNCGGCGSVCSLQNASQSCATGTCQISSCSSGFGNCDGNHANGCEVNLNTTVAHCGGCGQACSSANGTASCGAGNCSITCNSGYADCNNNPRADGCEVSTTTLTNCGTCGAVCSLLNASETCTTGTCQISSCSSGFSNCDGIHGNGCECPGNTCCSGSCAIQHDTGLGQNWYDCVAYGTYNSVQATKACQAWVAATGAANSCEQISCGDGTAMCSLNGGSSLSACWGFASGIAGRVYSTTHNTQYCPISTDPMWDP